jgi:hypothetical protein
LHLLQARAGRIVAPIEALHRSTRSMNFTHYAARLAHLALATIIVLAEGLIFKIGAA